MYFSVKRLFIFEKKYLKSICMKLTSYDNYLYQINFEGNYAI